jgi:hypothetical protein
MATVYSSRTCFLKLCCSIAVVGLFIAGILIIGAYPHPDLGDFNLNQTDVIAEETNLASTGNLTLAAETLAVTQASNEALYAHLDKVSEQVDENFQELADRISRSPRATATTAQNKALQTILLPNIFRNTDIEEAILHKILHQASNSKSRVSRSPRALKTIQALEVAIAMFQGNQPEPKYQSSEYATGNKRWKRAPSVHPIEIRELLNYEAQKKHHKNKILGDKVAQIFKQNTDLSDKIAEENQTPSERLKKDPIMALVTKTVSTYMFLRHSRDRKTKTQTEDFSWGEPFFKKKE